MSSPCSGVISSDILLYDICLGLELFTSIVPFLDIKDNAPFISEIPSSLTTLLYIVTGL